MKYNSKQEVFDAVVSHAESMTTPSRKERVCLYRGVDGSKCLVGGLIDDEDYVIEMDLPVDNNGTDVHSLAERGILPEYLTKYVDLLSQCQKCHDGDDLDPFNFVSGDDDVEWKNDMIQSLKEVAVNFKLQYNGVL